MFTMPEGVRLGKGTVKENAKLTGKESKTCGLAAEIVKPYDSC